MTLKLCLLLTALLLGCSDASPPSGPVATPDASPAGDAGSSPDELPPAECTRHSDCADSEAVRNAGRCGPEYWCEATRCKAACGAQCETVSTSVNSCSDGQLCVSNAIRPVGRCSRLPVPCDTPADCPAYRPPTDAGAQADWECREHVCRYPGWTYAVE